MFEKDQFIQDCIAEISEGPQAIREIVLQAVSDRAGILSELGPPQQAGITTLHRSSELTILNFAWAPNMSLMPHNHQMPAVIGVYAGREDNVFWRRTENSIEAAGAKTLGNGEVATLGRNIIHSVLNPIGKMTCALHVYSGDFFAPDEPRSEWDHETLIEQAWDIKRVKTLFHEAECRYKAFEGSR